MAYCIVFLGLYFNFHLLFGILTMDPVLVFGLPDLKPLDSQPFPNFLLEIIPSATPRIFCLSICIPSACFPFDHAVLSCGSVTLMLRDGRTYHMA